MLVKGNVANEKLLPFANSNERIVRSFSRMRQIT